MRGIAYKSTYISLKMVTFLKLYFLFMSTCPLLLGPFRSHISSVSLCTSDQTLFQQPCGTWNSDATEISASEICVRDLQTKRPAALRLLTSLPTVPSPEAWGVSLGFGWEAEPSVSMNICKVAQRTDTPPLPIIQQPNTWSLCWALEGPSSHSYESRVEACIWLCPSVWEHLEHWVLGHLPSLVIVKWRSLPWEKFQQKSNIPRNIAHQQNSKVLLKLALCDERQFSDEKWFSGGSIQIIFTAGMSERLLWCDLPWKGSIPPCPGAQALTTHRHWL